MQKLDEQLDKILGDMPEHNTRAEHAQIKGELIALVASTLQEIMPEKRAIPVERIDELDDSKPATYWIAAISQMEQNAKEKGIELENKS